MIRYELKKIWSRKVFLIAFILLIILDATKIIYENQKYRTNAAFDKARSELYSQVEGEWNMENISYIVSTYKNASDIVSSGNYSTEPNQPGTFTGYIFGDFSLFGEVCEKMNYMYNYSSSMENTLQKANENVELYEKLGNKYKSRENLKILEMYSGRSVSKFYDTDGAFALLSYDISAVIAMMLMILALSTVFTYEKETEMHLLLMTSLKGGIPLITAKIIAALTTAIIITVVFAVTDIATFTAVYNIKCFDIPLYSIEQFKNTSLSCTISTYLIINFAYKIAGMILIAFLYLIVSSISFDEIISFCGCFGVTMLLIFMGGKYSPVRLITSRELFINFETVNIFGVPVMSYITVILIVTLAIFLLVLIIYFTGSRKRIGKHSLKTVLSMAKELMS